MSQRARKFRSSLARGKWIEAISRKALMEGRVGLPSQEGSGLKHVKDVNREMWELSSLARGKWIEASRRTGYIYIRLSSLARGKWIEAPEPMLASATMPCLPSQEGSGLKHLAYTWKLTGGSLPSQEGSGLKRPIG